MPRRVCPAMNGRSKGEAPIGLRPKTPIFDSNLVLPHTVRLASAPLDLPFMAGQTRRLTHPFGMKTYAVQIKNAPKASAIPPSQP